MALKLSHTDETDTTWANAYHRVVIVNLDYAAKEAYIRVNVYKDKAARDANKKEIAIRQYYCRNVVNEDGTEDKQFDDNFDSTKLNPNEMNPTKKAYGVVSAKPEYKDAETV